MYVHAGAHVMSYIAEILTMIVHENNKTFAAGRAHDNGGASPLFPFTTNLALARYDPRNERDRCILIDDLRSLRSHFYDDETEQKA